jgi:hypothetical protein
VESVRRRAREQWLRAARYLALLEALGQQLLTAGLAVGEEVVGTADAALEDALQGGAGSAAAATG